MILKDTYWLLTVAENLSILDVCVGTVYGYGHFN